MPDASAQILEKMCSRVFKECSPVYFIIDRLGKIIQWGGKLSGLDMEEPVKGDLIADHVIFMEGILPLKGRTMEFSFIKLPCGICVDAFVFKMNNGYGLIIWNTCKKEDYLAQTKQQCNELSLLIEKQKKQLHQDEGKNISRQQTFFLENIFKALNYAVLEMNDQGHFVLIGTPPDWIEQIPQSNRMLSGDAYKEDVFSFLGNFIQEAKSRWQKNDLESFKSGLWIEKDQDGQELLFEATAINIHGTKLLIISHDICHPNEKQAIIQKGRNLALSYQDLQRSDHKLKQEKKEISRQLRQSQKMEAIGTLAGGIAHDFNNILSGIIGFTELALLESKKGSKLKERLEKVLHASDRAKELVQQILTFSHETGYEKKPLKLKLIVAEALTLLKASLPKNIKIKKNLKSDAYILADRTQMHQVTMNLCTNAWHAMSKDGGILEVNLAELDKPPDNLAGNCELTHDRYLALSVKDTGCGIQPGMVEKIFDPYFTTKGKDRGTGLGLSVVQGIVTKSNGCLTLTTQLGKGSCFTVYLPAFETQDNIKPMQASMPSGNNETILFVDDEVFQTEMADQILPLLGYQVVTCNDSMEALLLFSREMNRFDLVITDMSMPEMTGKTLAEKILKIHPDMPVILCSGYSDDIDPETIKQIGISQYLMKPIIMKDLAHTIKKALQKKEKL